MLEAVWVTSDLMGVVLASMGDECHSGAVPNVYHCDVCIADYSQEWNVRMYAGIVSVVNGRRGGPVSAMGL